ncbi:hypothetical protein ABH649_003277 [Vibrio cholerae]
MNYFAAFKKNLEQSGSLLCLSCRHSIFRHKLRFHQILASENVEAQEKELIALYKVQIPYLTCQTYEFYRSGISQLGLGSELDKQILDKGFASLGVDIHKEELKASYCKDRSLPVI